MLGKGFMGILKVFWKLYWDFEGFWFECDRARTKFFFVSSEMAMTI